MVAGCDDSGRGRGRGDVGGGVDLDDLMGNGSTHANPVSFHSRFGRDFPLCRVPRGVHLGSGPT